MTILLSDGEIRLTEAFAKNDDRKIVVYGKGQERSFHHLGGHLKVTLMDANGRMVSQGSAFYHEEIPVSSPRLNPIAESEVRFDTEFPPIAGIAYVLVQHESEPMKPKPRKSLLSAIFGEW